MSSSDSASQAKDLRDRAASLLQDAARCSDPVQRDALLGEALAQLNKARRLLDRPESHGANRPTTRAH